VIDHNLNMQAAINEAMAAYNEGEVPVGAALFIADRLIAAEHNRKEQLNSATAHAELLCINKACEIVGDWRLNEAMLYVTAEPCFMCAGAIIQARIPLVVFGVPEPKFGGVLTKAQLFDIPTLNHHVDYIAAVREDEIRAMMQAFFKELRKG
jgi:tRNA(adenine34) deaminase